MIYKESDFRQTKAAYDNSLQRTLICGVGVFGDEVYAASASVAIQQVYDRYWVWVRLTKAEYDAFPNNLETIRSLIDDEKRLLLTYRSMRPDIKSFDSDLLGPEPLGPGKNGK